MNYFLRETMLFFNKFYKFNSFTVNYLQRLPQVDTLGKPCNISITQIINYFNLLQKFTSQKRFCGKAFFLKWKLSFVKIY